MLLGILAAFCPSVLAFAPSEDVYAGIEPNRVLRYHAYQQARLRRAPPWEGFVAGAGAGWQARFDERTGTAHRAWGPGIALPDVSSPAAVESSIRGFLAKHPALLAVPLDTLRLRNAGYVARTDTWYVDFDRLVGGVPVWRGGVTARVRGGEIVLLGLDTYPDAAGPVSGVTYADVSRDDAILAAALDGPASLADHTDVSAELVMLPIDDGAALELRLVWEVRSRTASPVGHWVSHVDAGTGLLLNVYNEVRFFAGAVYGTHDTRTVDGSFTTSPMPLMKVTGSDGTTSFTGDAGNFTLLDTVTWTAGLSGSYLTVRNRGDGGSGSLAVTGASPTFTDASATQAEIDSYKFLHDVRAWGLEISPENGMATEALRSNVNLDSSCNAYFDGDVNFYESGDGCNNTGRIADVNYHEWGHGFHYYALQAGSFDGSLSEGVGDAVSNLLTADSVIGPYFYTNGPGIRDTSDLHVYPDDVTGEVHEDGLIFAGAVWDLWGDLLISLGGTRDDRGEAWRVTSTLLADGIKAGPTIPDVYDEFVAADDDDSDLGNGTPHLCEIVSAFGRHGLGPGGTASLLGVEHLPVGNQAARQPVRVDGTVLNLAPDCVDFTLSTATVRYSVDGGVTWESASLPVSGSGFDGEIPGLPDDTVVWYYVVAAATDGAEVSLPASGPVAPFSFYVGALEEIACESFEDSDGGYTHELIDGRDQRGADDWIWDRPRGMGGDADVAYSGDKVWGNDLGGADYNGEYQADIVNRLTSAPIELGDAASGPIVVQFRRWLTVEDGEYDNATVYVNDEPAWTNYVAGRNDDDTATEDLQWVLHTVRIENPSSPLSLAWELSSDGGLEFGGWNIDDVCVYATSATPEDTDVDPDDTDVGDDTGTPDGDDTGTGPGLEEDEGGIKIIQGTCGCATGTGAAPAGMLIGLAGLALARRRRT